MVQFNFKDKAKYINVNGQILEDFFTTKFFSPLYVGGAGTRTEPLRSNSIPGLVSSTTEAMILSSGIHKDTKNTYNIVSASSCFKYLNGNGIDNTILDNLIVSTTNSATATANIYVKDIKLNNLSCDSSSVYSSHAFSWNWNFLNCEISGSINKILGGGSRTTFNFTRCLHRVIVPSTPTVSVTTYNNNNSFAGVITTIGSFAGSLHTFEKSNLIVNQASLDSYKNNYYAFDNCNFRIGTETEYTPLTGTTAEDLRSNFVARCTAAGLTVPADITDYGITLTLGRWLFTKNQILEGITWAGSEINQFEIPRFISLGYSASRGTKIPITAGDKLFPSFAPRNPNSVGLIFGDDSLSIAAGIDITKHNSLYADSNIIWLGGKKKLTNIDVPNSLPQLYGVLIDSLPNLGNEVNNIIEAGEMYIVRSLNENAASIIYNGNTYSSALSTRNNIFKGVAGVNSYAFVSGSPSVYKINDILGYQSIQLRIVNKIPSDIIGVGSSLKMGYWYFVEHDTDQNNTTDYVKVGGVKYYVGDSFLIDSSGMENGLTITGTVHLRRCWKQDFVFESETIDKDFWQNEQKPEWCDILPEDTRCLMKNNSEKSVEMMRGDDGKYITTGHPEYYNRITGASGVQSPSDIFIQGTYMQIRLQVTTANPM